MIWKLNYITDDYQWWIMIIYNVNYLYYHIKQELNDETNKKIINKKCQWNDDMIITNWII